MIYLPRSSLLLGSVPPLPSLFKQFLYFTQIPHTFLHLNIVQILMGCSVLDMLFQLDLSLLEVLFIYTVKMSQKEKFSLSAHSSSIQLEISLSDSCKGWAKGHILCPTLGVVHLRVQTEFFLRNVCWRFRVGYASITLFMSCCYFLIVINLLTIFMLF